MGHHHWFAAFAASPLFLMLLLLLCAIGLVKHEAISISLEKYDKCDKGDSLLLDLFFDLWQQGEVTDVEHEITGFSKRMKGR